MNLLVDIGNTRIKWGIDDNGEITPGLAIEHKTGAFSRLVEEQWHSLKSPDNLAISSVTAKQTTELIVDIALKLWPEIIIILARSTAEALSISNAYAQPEKLGIDRWLNLMALQHYYPGNSCVVDCGTAITIDCINRQGQHLGGLISPGIQLMKQALFQGTDELMLSTEHYTATLSNTTESAIYTGTLFAAAGLIEKTMNDICTSETMVLTGGDAYILAPYLKGEYIIDVDFVLKGLSLYCREGDK